MIYLFMSSLAQIDMWDPKPGLVDWFDEELPSPFEWGSD